MRLQQYINQTSNSQVQQDAMNLLELAVFFEDYGKLDEGVGEVIKDIKDKTLKLLKKTGVHVSTGKGLIHYLWTINKNILRLLYHALNYSTNLAPHEKKESADAIKEIMKSVNREEIMNFLYKLDLVTLHAVTGPLKIIDALTGVHIAGEVSKKIKPAVERAKQAIEWLEATKNSLEGKLKAQVQKYVNALRRIFNLGDFKTITQKG